MARLCTVGYLPRKELLTGVENATIDPRYTMHRRTDGWLMNFSALEPIQSWADVIQSGIRPENVLLLGIDGGKIAGFEYHLAAMLGAQTAVIRRSGRMADRITYEEHLPGHEQFRLLPMDAESVRAFVSAPKPHPLIEKNKERLAGLIHESFEATKQEIEASKHSERIRTAFKRSNLGQAMHIADKLHHLGLDVAPIRDKRPAQTIPEEAIMDLAKMEHGRWVVERTLAGWRYAKKRNNDLLHHPGPGALDRTDRFGPQEGYRCGQRDPPLTQQVSIEKL